MQRLEELGGHIQAQEKVGCDHTVMHHGDGIGESGHKFKTWSLWDLCDGEGRNDKCIECPTFLG